MDVPIGSGEHYVEHVFIEKYRNLTFLIALGIPKTWLKLVWMLYIRGVYQTKVSRLKYYDFFKDVLKRK